MVFGMVGPNKSADTHFLLPMKAETDGAVKLGQPEEYKSTKDFGFLPIPRRLHYHHDQPPHFGLMRNIAFGLFSTFSPYSSSE